MLLSPTPQPCTISYSLRSSTDFYLKPYYLTLCTYLGAVPSSPCLSFTRAQSPAQICIALLYVMVPGTTS